MTKEELISIVAIVNASWPADGDLKEIYAAWWRYLGDLDRDAVQAVVDTLVIEASPWRPKVGEIRRRVVDGGTPWPSADGAWALAETCMAAAASGIDVPAMEPAVAEVMRGCLKSIGRYGGKAAFCDAWRAATAERYVLKQQ